MFAIVWEIVAVVRSWRERYRARCQLAAMTERELQDMGTCRSEMADEFNKPFWLR
jgi:uncharacterized protein YjiS (DUF1127 family)